MVVRPRALWCVVRVREDSSLTVMAPHQRIVPRELAGWAPGHTSHKDPLQIRALVVLLTPPLKGHILPREQTPQPRRRSSGMPRTKNVPRRSEGGAVPEQQRAAAASAVAPARAFHPNAPAPLGAGPLGRLG
jgi:hypothetical protein